MSKPRSRSFWPVLALLVLLVIAACVLLGFTTCNPRDIVGVHVKNIPTGTRFFSLAAMTDKGPVTMLWASPYHIRIGPPSASHPATKGEDVRNSNGEWWDTTYWKTGEKYGVVMQTKKGEWRIAWFPAVDVPIQRRNWLIGEGQVEFDLSKAEIVPLDADTVEALGLQDVKPEK